MNDIDICFMLRVTPVEGSAARAVLYGKSGGEWTPKWSTDVFIGRNGIGKQMEGDGKTPAGELHVTGAFGILPNPGTTLEYLEVTPDTIACDRQGPFYNRIVSREQTGCEGEEMFAMRPEYEYGLITDYNKDNVFPLGSAIFLHCKGKKRYTAGCIAFDRDKMKELVIAAGRGMTVTVG